VGTVHNGTATSWETHTGRVLRLGRHVDALKLGYVAGSGRELWWRRAVRRRAGSSGGRGGGSAEWSRPIILVTAPAGFGKTWLFQSLFARLHAHFHAAKQRQEKARRALPLLPGI